MVHIKKSSQGVNKWKSREGSFTSTQINSQVEVQLNWLLGLTVACLFLKLHSRLKMEALLEFANLRLLQTPKNMLSLVTTVISETSWAPSTWIFKRIKLKKKRKMRNFDDAFLSNKISKLYTTLHNTLYNCY